MTAPTDIRTRTKVGSLIVGSENMRVGPFPKENYQFHRLVPLSASRVTGQCTLDFTAGPSNDYPRARQFNGHMAWASPVFMNYT